MYLGHIIKNKSKLFVLCTANVDSQHKVKRSSRADFKGFLKIGSKNGGVFM